MASLQEFIHFCDKNGEKKLPTFITTWEYRQPRLVLHQRYTRIFGDMAPQNSSLEGTIMGYVLVITIPITFNKYSLVYNDLYICIDKFFKYLGFFFH